VGVLRPMQPAMPAGVIPMQSPVGLLLQPAAAAAAAGPAVTGVEPPMQPAAVAAATAATPPHTAEEVGQPDSAGAAGNKGLPGGSKRRFREAEGAVPEGSAQPLRWGMTGQRGETDRRWTTSTVSRLQLGEGWVEQPGHSEAGEGMPGEEQLSDVRRQRKPHACSRCGQHGHNKATCVQALTAEQLASVAVHGTVPHVPRAPMAPKADKVCKGWKSVTHEGWRCKSDLLRLTWNFGAAIRAPTNPALF
jgi:hypothetical protein